MIAFNLLEQMHAKPFKLVGADAGRDGRACLVQIGLDLGLRQPTHGHARDRDFLEQYLPVAGYRNRRV